MKGSEISRFVGNLKEPLFQLMEKIDRNGYGILFLLDDDGSLVASISDGDLRRWIIKNGNLNADVSQIANFKPRFLYIKDKNIAGTFMQEQRISMVPILDQRKRIIDICVCFELEEEFNSKDSHALEDTKVIIMAGGKGTRLFPYTKILPKPLIPIGDIPILERILQQFISYGAENIFLVVNYKKEMIKAYFSELYSVYKIKYVDEDSPLGTAGGVRLIKESFDKPVIITNCDTIIDADYGDIMRHHIESGNDMTIVSSYKDTQIRYGVIHAKEGGQIESIEEKPHIAYFINTGMYVVNPEYLKLIPENEAYNMTDLSEKLICLGKKVGMYPIGEKSFLDMGEFEEMKRMEDIIADRKMGRG